MKTNLTIAVPAYNIQKYIGPCIDSILSQNVRPEKLLIMDDGSTDNTGKICDQYASEYSFIQVFHQPNQGESTARNFLLDRCDTSYIWFVDGDDLIQKDSISQIVSVLKGTEDILFFEFVWYQEEIKKDFSNKCRDLSPEEINELRAQNIFYMKNSSLSEIRPTSASFCVFNVETLNKNKIRFNKEVYRGEDTLFTGNVLVFARSVRFLDSPCYIYRRNENSQTVKFDPELANSGLKSIRFREKLVHENYQGNSLIQRHLKGYLISYMRPFLYQNCCNSRNPKNYQERKQDFIRLISDPSISDAYKDLSVLQLSPADRIIFKLIQKEKFFWLNLLYRSVTRLGLITK